MQNIKLNFPIFIFLFPLFLFFQGCASSNVAREANDNVAVGYQNATSSFENMGNGSAADTVENASQSAKGAFMGGAVGAIAGGLTTGVGVVPGLAGGAILGGAYGAYIDSNTSLTDQLENRGVKVMILGDHIMIVLRSNRIFNAMTPVIRPGAYSTLDLVSLYINSYHTMLVRVAAYTSTTGAERINLALSKEQADSLVRYLKQRATNTRMISAVGMGGVNPVTADAPTDWDSSLNYRVEITMEKLPVTGTLS